jgi:tetratricopeptide (TPR) repeat protein
VKPGDPVDTRAVEIQQMESLLQSMPSAAPNRVELLRRLADTYSSLSDERRDARAAATLYYKTIAAEYGGDPSNRFPTNPPPMYEHLDEVLYALGYAYEQTGGADNASNVYFTLIQKLPKSAYVANAYTGFGDIFFDESTQDPLKLRMAQTSYEHALKFDQELDALAAYAAYKLGYVHWREGEADAAQAAFGRSVIIAAQAGDAAKRIGDAANRALTTLRGGKTTCSP